ncbi:prolipoprotein diacylglyceryl transferase [Nitritalea halalkaliphila LW7]|uniref:Phosphatidylglycerol--prolipoprotein diacylglyceryl transferase n=1 Tax=Nitritalea halalkaliphila LW7 TaxID=1189621 RepID=I5C2V4_9BACT|nr:prolipoprotein diacylglyceryl transferase [Nitritalea halalkaliphila]EIM76156.1 prolipoprotein diacylglyceryl transferase [Nitritalea halalkaliphila LW7]
MLHTLLAYTVWDADPAIFSAFPRLRWYSVLFALGFIISQQIMVYFFTKEGHKAELVDRLTIYMVLSTIIGARLGHVLFYEPDRYLSNPIDILKVWEGGLASHGAAFAILFALYLYARKTPGQSYLWVVDRIVIVTAMVGAMIRIGNLMNSEIGGKPTESDSGFVFAREAVEIMRELKVPILDVNAYKPDNRQSELVGNGIVPVNFELQVAKGAFEKEELERVLGQDIKYILTRYRSSQKYLAEPAEGTVTMSISDQGSSYRVTVETFGIARHPTQIYESLSYFLIFLLLLVLWIRMKERVPEGLLLGLFLILVFGMRFFWEFMKENQVEFEEGLQFNMGQLLSIPLVIAGIILVVRALKNGAPQPPSLEKKA